MKPNTIIQSLFISVSFGFLGLVSTYFASKFYSDEDVVLSYKDILIIIIPAFLVSAIVLSNIEHLIQKNKFDFILSIFLMALLAASIHRLLLVDFEFGFFIDLNLGCFYSSFWWSMYGIILITTISYFLYPVLKKQSERNKLITKILTKSLK